LSQEAFIEKIANQYGIDTEGRMPNILMTEVELLPADTRVDVASALRYQCKMRSLLYAAITTRPDVAFAVLRLAWFNRNSMPIHHEAVDRVIRYLYGLKHMAICYGGDTGGSGTQAFIYASNASFADNSIDRKSSQGYIMMLFNGAISWRANKQDTVTTSSTEAELLALSQTAKEGIFLSRLFKALSLSLNEPLTIDCDNTQTLRLIKEESAKLVTKLRHVDIHSH
jgi:hypothetical protein